MSDDLVKKLRSQIGDDVQEVYAPEALFRLAAARIAELEVHIVTYRAQLDSTLKDRALVMARAIAAERADALRMAVDAARQIANHNRDHWREDMAAGADEAADAIEVMIPGKESHE